MPGSNASLVMAIKQKLRYTSHAAAILFYILKKSLNEIQGTILQTAV
jgi:hypothetical protein